MQNEISLVTENPNGLAKATDSVIDTKNRQKTLLQKARLTSHLSKICILQRQYGKTESDLEVLVEGFVWALEGYDFEEMLVAIKDFIRADPNIPTPSDVIKIIEGWRSAERAKEFYRARDEREEQRAKEK